MSMINLNTQVQHIPNTPEQERDIEKSTKEFANVFLKMIFREMFNSEEPSELFGDSHSGEIWKSMWVDTMSEACSGKSGIEPVIRASFQRKINPYYNNLYKDVSDDRQIGGKIHEYA
ncbi:MAG TPA: hypothetical protein DIC42_01165 [Holosporales bacterium]|nr:hypothetical protein [Holosporales bacterium]